MTTHHINEHDINGKQKRKEKEGTSDLKGQIEARIKITSKKSQSPKTRATARHN
ncbi:MAG TPA: hypothetical protein VFK94_05035 [Patescibacteria group bacterium]|nr:hypothetical protein [Patescibacteria group bacterium]